ncbi:hypothetical protein [Staphylococcus rostri]|uniref:Uncharacterized protein n=1 Tax=Staphylococcus rostri TaxID=522262 RepID=A0A2K3YIT4_9STAP|nr:hypothetical protein [Staphylococcus rostri]PNZ25505.1 hypothetical protein CD122_09790 [Staphylococcus rostri]
MMTLLKRNLNLTDQSRYMRIGSYIFIFLIAICYYILDPNLFIAYMVLLMLALSFSPIFINHYLNRNKAYIMFRSLPMSDHKLLASFNLLTWLICAIQITSTAFVWLIAPLPMVFEIMATQLGITFFIATFCIKTMLEEATSKWRTYGIGLFLVFQLFLGIIGPLLVGVDLFWFRVFPWVFLIISFFSYQIKTLIRYRRLGHNKINL